MKYSEEQVEWIVAEVLRRLGVDGGSTAYKPSGTGELLLPERVETMRVVEGRLANVSRVVVGPRAVVTPAVIDELKQKKIELAREGQT
jgi:hypothetical protein